MKTYLAVFTAFLAIGASSVSYGWRPSYGAIAISPSTGFRGETWGRWNILDAQLGARLNCGVADCFVAVTVSNACASVAMGFGGAYGYAIRGNAVLATQAALLNCAVRTGNCLTMGTVCTAPLPY